MKIIIIETKEGNQVFNYETGIFIATFKTNALLLLAMFANGWEIIKEKGTGI